MKFNDEPYFSLVADIIAVDARNLSQFSPWLRIFFVREDFHAPSWVDDWRIAFAVAVDVFYWNAQKLTMANCCWANTDLLLFNYDHPDCKVLLSNSGVESQRDLWYSSFCSPLRYRSVCFLFEHSCS